MTDTPKLGLPEIAESQAQKYLTHNQALRMLDVFTQMSVLDRSLTAPPGGEDEGDAYIVAAGTTGSWTGHYNDIAYFIGGAYQFIAPRDGWLVFVADENQYYKYDAGSPNGWFAFEAGTSFLGLSDTPGAYAGAARYVLRVNPGQSDVEFVNIFKQDSSAPASAPAEQGFLHLDTTNLRVYIGYDDSDVGDFKDPLGANLRTVTSSITLTKSDHGKTILVNSASNLTITLPQSSTEDLRENFACNIVRYGTGTVTIAKQGSDTIVSKDSVLTLHSQYSMAVVVKISDGSPSVWGLFGDIA